MEWLENPKHRYRINQGVRPYGGCLLTPEYEDEKKVGGRISGVPYRRWYRMDEVTLVK